jgi:hypothetical protein
VNEHGPQHSGSRWEPVPDASGATTTAPSAGPAAAPTADLPPVGPGQTAVQPPLGEVQPAETPPAAISEQATPTSATPKRLPARLRRRMVTAAAAVALVAAGGAGGFAIATAAAGDDSEVGTDESTVPGTDDQTGRDGFPGDRPDFGGRPRPGFDDGDTA